MSDCFASFWICAFVSILFWLNFDGENVRPNCFCDAHSSKNDIQFSIETIFNYIFVLNFFLFPISSSLIVIHTEQTWGMWTRTPPTECDSGCGTAIGTGPGLEKWNFISRKRKKEENTLVENLNKWIFFYQRLLRRWKSKKERTSF